MSAEVAVALSDAAIERASGDPLRSLDLVVRWREIAGIVGENGSGKSALLDAIACGAASTGRLVRDDSVAHLREDPAYPDDLTVSEVIRIASADFPEWNQQSAARFAEELGLPLDRQVWRLSRGMRSAIGMVLGVASGARLLVFDEPFLGSDRRSAALLGRALRAHADAGGAAVLATVRADLLPGLLDTVVVLRGGALGPKRVATEDVIESLDF